MYVAYIIPACAGIAVAIIEALAGLDRKRAKAESEKVTMRASQRAEESRLSMKMMSATLKLSVVTANALTNGHNNGNVEEARIAAREAEEEYANFVAKLAADELSK